MAHRKIRRHAINIAVVKIAVIAIVVLCAPFGDRIIRAEQKAAPARSAAASPPFSGAVAPLSGILPVVVNIPPRVTTPEQARPFFDDFSWRSFIALNWPALPDEHGVPRSPNDPKVLLDAGKNYPTVWGTDREAYELYRIDNATPAAFASTAVTNTVCGPASPGTKILLMAAKSGTLLGDVDQAFSFPLVDQNNNYIYYEIRFNADQYDFVRGNGLYLAKNLQAAEMKAPIAMPISSAQPYKQGAVMLKAAWKQMTPADDPSRYYTVAARILDTSQRQPVCRDVTMGLVGFHIGHKVQGLAQWIWSSFEQVDNVPFFQSQSDAAGAGGNSCMQCHYVVGNADFSWSLVLRSK
jgi:hypothetical protein